MNRNPSDKHVIVIGAGPGGLTAAMILARRGLNVTVLEAQERIGGRNKAIRLGPYTFDTGPTFLMLKRILDEVFREAGADTASLLNMHRIDPMYTLQMRDKQMEVTSDHEQMQEEIKRCFPGREVYLQDFLRRESARFRRLYPCLQKSYHRFRTLFHPNVLMAIPHLALGQTLFSVMKRRFRNEELALCFTFQAKYLGMSPWVCPGLFSIIPYIEHAFGIYHPIGGLSRISDAMAEVAMGNGARIRVNAPVRRIITRDRIAQGVELKNGERLFADDVIINADFGHAMSSLFEPGVLRKYTPRRLNRMQLSCSTFMLYLGVDTTYDKPHHLIVFADDYKNNVNGVFAGRRPSRDFSFYVRNASVTDSTLAPAGHAALYVLVPVSNLRGDPDWQKEGHEFREVVVNALEQRAGFTNLRKHIREERVLTPLDWRDAYDVYAGATFNLAHNLGQMVYFRPRNKFEDVDNCYLAGGGTHPGSGLPTIYESGRIAANLICRRRGVAFESRNLHV